MQRTLQLVSVLFLSASLLGCVSAKQRLEEQRELERSIRKTSDPDAVKGCSFIMNLRPDGLHKTPEAQAASLVVPQSGVSWVVFGGPGHYELYSCFRKAAQEVQEAKAPTPAPVETGPTVGAPVEAKAVPGQSEAKPEAIMKDQTEAKTTATEPAKGNLFRTRVTSNPEAVKGCRFLESFADYRKVSRFQEDVVRTGGNLGYVVATNRDGEVIGESYLCSETAKP